MSGGHKCKNCGSADIEVDNARGDAVCTNCGSVLEDNIIVSEVQFEENAHGAHSAVGQFVSADSKGVGGGGVYGKFHMGSGRESREVTLRKARDGIALLCQQLSLNNHCIDTACNFFKMALNRHLTRGRRNTHIFAACVYITCRTEGTSHLLIDISDVLRICCYELGRTYLKLTQSLCINIPSVDPCLYIMRFASKLEFGERTHEVSMTAQRLVQRMKKDSIHSGRRPSGLCGAALLLAARMHDFNRTPTDIVRIVKIHETTLRKRLLEFGETPSSVLTIEEFMTVDLEAEQDPPAFKAARKKDKELINKIAENEHEFSELQREIEANLEHEVGRSKKRGRSVVPAEIVSEVDSAFETIFIRDSTLDSIKGALQEGSGDTGEGTSSALEKEVEKVSGIAPDILAICSNTQSAAAAAAAASANEQLHDSDTILDDIEDDEINSYILNEAEAKKKNDLWRKLNADYLEEVRIREERLEKEREEGKPDKKRKKTSRKKQMEPSSTAGEAIEKILQEKKISSKINYDILKSLTVDKELVEAKVEPETEQQPAAAARETQFLLPTRRKIGSELLLPNKSRRGRAMLEMGLPVAADQVPKLEKVTETGPSQEEAEVEEEPEVELETEPAGHSSLATMLNNGAEEDYFGYDEDY